LDLKLFINRQNPEYVKGKLVKKVIGRMSLDLSLLSMKKEQKLHMDVMHVDRKKFLINLMVQSWVKREDRTEMGLALQGQLGLLWSKVSSQG
jgi:hypothetical protein